MGSLWLAAVLLVLLLVGMGCATVYESSHGTEAAQQVYYRAWWFHALWLLMAVNVLAAIVVRWPFSWRQAGFVMTHVGLLVVLAGFWITRAYGFEGQLGLLEGGAADRITLPGSEQLLLRQTLDGAEQTLSVTSLCPDRFSIANVEDHNKIRVGDLGAELVRYMPDCEWRQNVTDDNPAAQPAVEVSLAGGPIDDRIVVFANQTAPIADQQVMFRFLTNAAELTQLASPSGSAPASKGTIRVDHAGRTFEFTVEEGLARPMQIENTDLVARVKRYLPHAVVGQGGEMSSASDRPENPYAEVELTGPSGTKLHRAFARFPDFGGAEGDADKVRLIAETAAQSPGAPIEILAAPDQSLHVRFTVQNQSSPPKPVKIGEAVSTPWAGEQLKILRRLDHARRQWSLDPITPPRSQRQPGILVRLSTGAQVHEIGLQRYQSRSFNVDDKPYEIAYQDQTLALPFTVSLEQFRIGYYPGGQRPRTFESRVTLGDRATKSVQQTLISMNNPAEFAGYRLYQSSYRQEGQRWISILSIARDFGQTVVFAGYILVGAGMLVVLGIRMRAQRKAAELLREMGMSADGVQMSAPR
ncbi:MAG: cytochrome c biogenesis protein ResB [Planctomycetes bacterium]|nr:cytochrome c biogenesis protein ResB [Planctomycetota bacterium]